MQVKVPKSVLKAQAKLTLKFVQQLAADLKMMSPILTGLSLSMILEYSEKHTAKQIEKAIGKDHLAVRNFYQSVIEILNAIDGSDELKPAICIFLASDSGIGFSDNFLKYLDVYKVTAKRLVDHNELADAINDFISEYTHMPTYPELVACQATHNWRTDSLVPFVDAIDVEEIGESQVIFANTLDFSAPFAEPFKTYNTHPEAFFVSESKTMTVNMMSQQAMNCNYFESDTYKAVSKTYKHRGFGTNFCRLLFVLPKKHDGLNQVLNEIDYEKLLDITLPPPRPEMNYKIVKYVDKDGVEVNYGGGIPLHRQKKVSLNTWAYDLKVNLKVPKFEARSSIYVDGMLKSLGVKDAFNPKKAKVQNMLESKLEGLHIGHMVQQVVFSVNEAGTNISGKKDSYPQIPKYPPTLPQPVPSKEFNCDHPFAFILADNNGINLLTGICDHTNVSVFEAKDFKKTRVRASKILISSDDSKNTDVIGHDEDPIEFKEKFESISAEGVPELAADKHAAATDHSDGEEDGVDIIEDSSDSERE